jgi:hypothetical protein
MVEDHIETGRLIRLHLKDYDSLPLPISVAYLTKHPPGRAGRWLVDDLRPKLAACPEKYRGEALTPKKRRA